MAKERRTYTDDEIAQVMTTLKSNNGGLLKTSRETGVPFSTLQQWADGSVKRVGEVVKDKAGDYEIFYSSMLFTVGEKLLAALDNDKKIEDSTLPQISTALGVVLDKATALFDLGKALAAREKGEAVLNARLIALGERREADPQAD